MFFSALSAKAQEEITLYNPSFEGKPHAGSSNSEGIRYWTDCGNIYFNGETPPDLHSAYSKYFEHTGLPSHGETYVGLVSRENDTYESISQRLSSPLKAGECYSFAIDLMRSTHYYSATKENGDGLYNYAKPIKFYIYGGTGLCGDQELLAVTDYVKNPKWETYSFTFQPTKAIRYITFQASYKRPTFFPYNGNILVDNAQSIKAIPCPGEEIVAEATPPKTNVPPHKRRPKKTPPKAKPPVAQDQPATAQASKQSILNLDRNNLAKDQTFEIKKLYFTADRADINPKSFDVLNEVSYFLQENKDITIEVGGHTNTLPKHPFCDSLSTARAKSVAVYLVQKGVDPNRIKYKGYGKRRPKGRFNTAEGRRRNQRVEIKILSMNG